MYNTVKERVFGQTQTQTKSISNNEQWLPDSLSAKILDLQFQCEDQNISNQRIFKLIALYTKAVEYYEERGNPKYAIYQKRMHHFLKQPQIKMILKGVPGELAVKKEESQQIVRKVAASSFKQAKSIIEKSQENSQKQKQKIQDSINQQNSYLQEKIQRKRAMSNRSTRSGPNEIPGEERTDKRQEMNMKLILDSINQRKNQGKKVFF